MQTYKITLTDTATYIIRAASREAAEDLACDWFSEREPNVAVSVTDEEPEYTLED